MLGGLIGCETDGQKMQDLRAHEETREAEMTLKLAHEQSNLHDCLEHLHVNR